MTASANPVRVLVLLGAIPLYGTELATIEVGRILRDAGAEVLFVTNAHWAHQAIAPRLDRLGLRHVGLVFFGSIERGLTWRRLASMLRWQVSENWKLWRVLREFRPTHVHVASHWDYFNLIVGLSWSRARLIFHAHNLPVVRHGLSGWLWRRIFARASRIVAVSKFLAARFVALHAPRERLRVIGNAVPARGAVTAGDAPVRRQGGELHVVYVGQMAEDKGVGDLVDAIAALRARGMRVRCTLVGALTGAWATALRDRLAGQGDAIAFAGYVDDPTVHFAAADVHVLPSRLDETFGLVVVEAKVAGTPSIVSDRGALPELVTDGVDGSIVPVGDVAGLAQAMARYADDPSLRDRQAVAARQSLHRLGLDDVPRQWRELYGLPA